MQGDIIVVENLSKTFDNKKVLDRLNFSIPQNKTVCIIGKSGVGKSVLIKCMIGLIIPDDDSVILINGIDVAKKHISARIQEKTAKCSLVFQGNALFDSLTIFENVMFSALDNNSLSIEEKRKMAIDTLKMVSLDEDILDLYPYNVSGGMQKRIGLARALVSKPDILFLDEPTAGLDPITASTIHFLIKDIKKKLNVTIVTITHDVKCMERIADYVLLLENGKVGWYGEIDLINENIQNEFLKEISMIQ